ncbi:hypothetical protein EVAR_59677_1 [Eumeta japonica]|uniref:Uncharacterized protein n=1 Tax=Eumeta variegata TaxID=151549 RepID=A0A4C1ZLQ6_EUMVA|nr:hypothetical protein EVAR_59677_1 [Eumeta japonica]
MSDFQGLMMETEGSDDRARRQTQELHNETTYLSRVWSCRNRLEMYFDHERFSGCDDGARSGVGSLEAPSSDPKSQSWSKYISGQFQLAQIWLG